MPTVQASYFLGQRLLAQTTFKATITQRSLMYTCLTCGEVWGRVVCITDGKPGVWDVVTCPCEKHKPIGVQDWGTTPGAFTLSPFRAGADAGQLQNLPDTLLSREFLLHLSHHESQRHASPYSDRT